MANQIKKNVSSSLLICIVSLFFIAGHSFGATGYISDRLIVSIKDSLTEPSKTLTRIQTGEEVEILGTQDRHHLVRTEDGTEGWILKQYILFTEPKEILISTLETEKKQLEKVIEKQKEQHTKELDEIRQTLEASSDQSILVEKVRQLEELQSQLNNEQKKNDDLSQLITTLQDKQTDFQTAQRALSELKNKHEQLQKETTRLKNRLKISPNKNGDLFSDIDPRITWLAAGAIILILGIFIGKSGRRRRQKSKLTF